MPTQLANDLSTLPTSAPSVAPAPQPAQQQPVTPAPTTTQPSSTGVLDPQAVALAKAIRQTESNGNFQAAGKSGEYGAYQWEPATWAAQSAAAGVNVPLQQATPAQQNQVAYTQIKKWKDQGYNVGQIASMWNAGEGDPDAYINGNKGTNSSGVSYDTKAYAQKVATAYQQFKTQQSTQTDTQPQSTSLLGDIGNLAKGAANLVVGPAESLGTHLGQIGAGLTADFAAKTGLLGGQAEADKINAKLAQPQTTLTGGTVQPLKSGLGGAEQIGGDTLQTGLLAAGPEVGGFESVAGRLGANAALGAGFGVGNAMSQGGSATDVGEGALTGGLIGGAVGGAGELLNKAATYLPQRIARSFIPGINGETAQYAVDKGLGTPAKMLSQSNNSLSKIGSSIGKAVQGAVADGAVLPKGEDLFNTIAEQFPDAGLTGEDVAANLKKLVPLKASLVDKISNGTATLEDLQGLNSALGKATFKTVFDDPTVKAGKEVGNAMYHEFGDLIKSYLSPDEGALYDEYTKESALNGALQKAVRSGQKAKMFTLRDLVALTSGFGAGSMFGAGPVGAAVGYAGEKALNSPGLNMKVGGLLSKLATPTAKVIGNNLKGPALKGLTGLLQGQKQ